MKPLIDKWKNRFCCTETYEDSKRIRNSICCEEECELIFKIENKELDFSLAEKEVGYILPDKFKSLFKGLSFSIKDSFGNSDFCFFSGMKKFHISNDDWGNQELKFLLGNGIPFAKSPRSDDGTLFVTQNETGHFYVGYYNHDVVTVEELELVYADRRVLSVIDTHINEYYNNFYYNF